MNPRRVVVTGMGALTPIGNTLNQFWDGLISGTSGSNNITHFDATKFKTKFACEVKGYDPLDFFEKKEVRRYDKFTQYALIVAKEAIEDAKLVESKVNNDNVGVIWGAGIGGVDTLEN